MTAGIASGLFWFALFVIAQWTFFYARAVRDRARCTLLLFGAGLIGQLLSVLFVLHFPDARDILRSSHAASTFAGFLVMASLFVLYMPFYYTIATSLSVQSLVMVARGGGAMPISELAHAFASEAVLHARLESMARNGYLIERARAYHIARKGMLIARLFLAIKNVWNLGPGG